MSSPVRCMPLGGMIPRFPSGVPGISEFKLRALDQERSTMVVLFCHLVVSLCHPMDCSTLGSPVLHQLSIYYRVYSVYYWCILVFSILSWLSLSRWLTRWYDCETHSLGSELALFRLFFYISPFTVKVDQGNSKKYWSESAGAKHFPPCPSCVTSGW